MQLIYEQYQLVKSSRQVVFNFCNRLPIQQYVEKMNQQGASIRHLHLHVANTYVHWISGFAMSNKIVYYQPDEYENIAAVEAVYQEIDELVSGFIEAFPDPSQKIVSTLPGRDTMEFTMLQLFTHVITHEFHHKGQIMTMIRRAGHIPPDADIIRT